MTKAQTILDQLGGRRFATMTGARNFIDLGNGLQFDLPRGTKNKATKVRVELNEKDLYDVRFVSVRNLSVIERGAFPDIYADRLQPLFTEQTGFDTHL